ncbi:hypothetical protein QCA50_016408 [Cerrena zonata]|uniref:Uncharacterized protein n=1 Tax=Cerrena zonata TaxID=2478898 RepID=A0AAW0FTC2_9APHY
MASQRMIRHIRRDDSHSGGGDGGDGRSGKQSNRKQVLDSDDSHNSNDKDPNSQGKHNNNDCDNNGDNNNNNNSKSPSSGSGSGGNSSSPDGTNSDPNNGKFLRDHCILVNNNDGSLRYNGSWTLDTNNRTGLTATNHTTTEASSQMSIAFNGTSIVVFGTVHQSNETVHPAMAAYSVDRGNPAT